MSCHVCVMCICRQYTAWNSGQRKITVSQVRANDLLSCTEERHFWLSWLGGHLAVGKGLKTGLHPVIAHIDLNPFQVTAIAFKSINNEASWRMPMSQGSYHTLIHPRVMKMSRVVSYELVIHRK